MKRVLALGALLCAGCATPGLRPLPRGPAPEAADVPARFASAMPSRFHLLNLVVLRSFGRGQSMLGMIEVDATNASFTAMGFTLTGVKIFEMTYAHGLLRQHLPFRIPGAPIDLGAAIGADIREMYLDLVPPADATARRAGGAVVYTARTDRGRTEYWFAGPDGYLAEKRTYTGRRNTYRIGYYDYSPTNGVVFPCEIVVRNARNHYVLTARPRRVQPR